MKIRVFSENYYALIIAVIKDVPVEESFLLLRDGTKRKKRGFSDDDIREMISMRESGKTFRYIGSLFYITPDLVYRTIIRHKERFKMKGVSSDGI